MTATSIASRKGLRGITIAWSILCLLTIGSWWLSPAHTSAPVTPNVAITMAVIAVGVIKSRLVIRCFMEVNAAPRWLRVATDCWLVLVWGGVGAIYLF